MRDLLLFIILFSVLMSIIFVSTTTSISKNPSLAVDTTAACGAPCSLEAGIGVATITRECIPIGEFVDRQYCCIDNDCAPDGRCVDGFCTQACIPNTCSSCGLVYDDNCREVPNGFCCSSPTSHCACIGPKNGCGVCQWTCGAAPECDGKFPGTGDCDNNCRFTGITPSACDPASCNNFGAICCPGIQSCVLWWEDENNCGECGIVCDEGEECVLNTPGVISSGAECKVTLTPPPPTATPPPP